MYPQVVADFHIGDQRRCGNRRPPLAKRTFLTAPSPDKPLAKARPRLLIAGVETNRILCGDVRTQLATLPAGCAQLIIADPPYHNVLTDEQWDTQWASTEAYVEWMQAWVTDALRVLRDDGLCFIFGQLGKREHAFIHVMSALCRAHQFHDLIIWDRVVGYNERRDSFTPAYEMILVLRKSDTPKFNKDAVREAYSPEKIQTYLKDKRYKDLDARRQHLEAGKFATNLLRVTSLKGISKEKCGHPSQKPLELIRKLVACASDPGDLVLDPFLGSGTTAVAAQSLGRRWLGIEIDPGYVSLAQARLTAGSETDSRNRPSRAESGACLPRPPSSPR